MEMLKIQLQDAGRIGKRNQILFGVFKTEDKNGEITTSCGHNRDYTLILHPECSEFKMSARGAV